MGREQGSTRAVRYAYGCCRCPQIAWEISELLAQTAVVPFCGAGLLASAAHRSSREQVTEIALPFSVDGSTGVWKKRRHAVLVFTLLYNSVGVFVNCSAPSTRSFYMDTSVI